MIITVTVSGGWAGLRSTCVIDTAHLAAPDAARIERAIGRCVEHDMPAPSPRVRDARTYRIEADHDGKHHVIFFSEAFAPPEAISMIGSLRPVCPDIA
jgi:hypothetical protein